MNLNHFFLNINNNYKKMYLINKSSIKDRFLKSLILNYSFKKNINELINNFLNRIKENEVNKTNIYQNKYTTKFIKKQLPYETGFTNCFYDWTNKHLEPSKIHEIKSGNNNNANYMHYYLYFISTGLFF